MTESLQHKIDTYRFLSGRDANFVDQAIQELREAIKAECYDTEEGDGFDSGRRSAFMFVLELIGEVERNNGRM